MHVESTDPNKQLVLALYQDCINSGRLEQLDDLIATEFAGPNGERGPAEFAGTVRGLRTGFPDIHFTIEDVIAEGDRVVVKWTWEGTHTGPFRGFSPTHKRVSNSGIGIYQIGGGKITRAWLQTDRLGFNQQIGVVPLNPVPTTQPARR